jgi:hypothetical protein
VFTRTISITIQGEDENDVLSAESSIEEAMGNEAYEMTQVYGIEVVY